MWIVSLSERRRVSVVHEYLRISTVSLQPKKVEGEAVRPVQGKVMVSTQDASRLLRELKLDGYLLFEIIARNTDDVIASKIIGGLLNRPALSSP